MAKIVPFKAVRPTRDKVGLVAARSYQSYSMEQREARLRDNPFSFLHIVNPGYKYDKTLIGEERYELVKNRYLEFKEENIFIQDTTPCYYIYKITDRDQQEFNGIIAAASAKDYEDNILKKHEETIEYREVIFKDYLKTVGFNAEPVLLTYPDNTVIAKIIAKVQKERPEYEFTTTYRDTHCLWKVNHPHLINPIVAEFEKMATLYIADGHHRCASSYLLYKELKAESKPYTGKESFNHFMVYAIPESDLKIHEYNRMVKGLNGLSKEAFLIALDASFRIENRGKFPYKPSKKHHFSMYLDGEYYSLYLRKTLYNLESSLDNLDTQVLHKTILEPILGITDARNDKRIVYVNGKNDVIDIKNSVDSGEFTVSFELLPITMQEIKNIADDGFKMPPKSTYIEPKLRSGITIYEF